MHKDFDKVCQLLTSSEIDAKVAIQILKGQPDLEEEIEVEFEPLLKIFNKKKLAAIPSIVAKIQTQKESKKQFLPLLQEPTFSNLLRNREELVIKNYPIEKLFNLGKFPVLKRLEIYGNKKLVELPKSLGEFPQLELFRLFENKIEEIPEQFFANLESLISLHINNNKLKTLPSSMGLLSNLGLLSISRNEFEILPDCIEELSMLEHLYLDRNKLKTLPEGLQKLKKLKCLSVAYNKNFSAIPDFFAELPALKDLHLDHNRLKHFPENIDALKHIKVLNLNGNKITSLPKSIQKLENLSSLHLYYNPISVEEQQKIKDWLPNVRIDFSS